jgi:hypothetical protein
MRTIEKRWARPICLRHPSICFSLAKSAISAADLRADAANRNCNVTETTGSRRSVRKHRTVSHRFLVISASVFLMLGGWVAGYLSGRELSSRPLVEAKQLIAQLQPENKRLEALAISQNARIKSLDAKLNTVQTAMDAMSPAENTYNIESNQAVVVADGRLIIGLIGSPSNQSVNININGKQHTAVSGDVFNIASDASTTCQVSVQSFDMFKAVVTASCVATKHQ